MTELVLTNRDISYGINGYPSKYFFKIEKWMKIFKSETPQTKVETKYVLLYERACVCVHVRVYLRTQTYLNLI